MLYENLFDIEKRPGTGLELWTKAVELQLERVREVNYRHRLHHSPNEAEKCEDPGAEHQLHADVYFLALAIRRIVLFHDAFYRQVQDPRLARARTAFDEAAPDAKTLRDFYEHLDEYLLDSKRKHIKIDGRASPVLHSRWDCDNVVVAFGHLEVDVTLAAVAAIALGRASSELWDEHLEKVKAKSPDKSPPSTDDGIPRTLELTFGRSSIIGDEDDPPVVFTGVLIDVCVREATHEEVARGEPERNSRG
jgi:hypothetical protein